MKRIALLILLLAIVILALMVKQVHLEGDHTSYLVLAPYPTLAFVYGGGEEGAWRRSHPQQPEPWWLARRYRVLVEL